MPYGADAEVPAAGPAVAAAAAHDVPLAGHPVTDGDARDVLPDLDDLAVELVADDVIGAVTVACAHSSQPLQVQVGAAQARPAAPGS